MSLLIDQSGGGVSPAVRNAVALDFDIEQGGTTIKVMNFTTSATLATFPANVCSAVANGATDITIEYTGGEEKIVTKLPTSAVKIAGTLQAAVQADILTALNSLFANAGGGVVPTITSSLTPSITEGGTLNYDLTGTGIVSVIWTNLPSGIAPVVGNEFKVIGGSGLTAAGSPYTFNVEAVNYHGSTTATITLTVSAAFTNTKSFHGTGNTWMRNFNNYDTTAFYRNGNGSGVTEAWSCSFWLKTAFTGSNNQSYGIIHYGKSGANVNGYMTLFHRTSNAGTNNRLVFRYGSYDCYFEADVDIGIASDTWFHFLMTYDGAATTNTGSGFFNFYVNGVLKTPTWTFSGAGQYYSGVTMSIQRNNSFDLLLLMARDAYTSTYAPNTKVEEFATWKGVELGVSDAVALYNTGSPFDINASFTPLPYTYWRCGDGNDANTHPTMNDVGTSGISPTMQSGSVANYVTDTP